jgi:hypothetical protein
MEKIQRKSGVHFELFVYSFSKKCHSVFRHNDLAHYWQKKKHEPQAITGNSQFSHVY